MLILLFFSQIPKPVPVKLWGNSVMLLYITAYCQGCCSNYILCILIITLSLKETMDSALQNLSNACSLINSIDPKAGGGGHQTENEAEHDSEDWRLEPPPPNEIDPS